MSPVLFIRQAVVFMQRGDALKARDLIGKAVDCGMPRADAVSMALAVYARAEGQPYGGKLA